MSKIFEIILWETLVHNALES